MDNRYNLSNLEALFKDFLITEKISRISIKNYMCDIRHFISWFMYTRLHSYEEGTHLDYFIEVISPGVIKDYITYYQENNLPISTINRRLSSLRKFFVFCVRRNILSENPISNIRNLERPVLNRKINDVETIEPLAKEEVSPVDDFVAYLTSKGEPVDEIVINEFKLFIE